MTRRTALIIAAVLLVALGCLAADFVYSMKPRFIDKTGNYVAAQETMYTKEFADALLAEFQRRGVSSDHLSRQVNENGQLVLPRQENYGLKPYPSDEELPVSWYIGDRYCFFDAHRLLFEAPANVLHVSEFREGLVAAATSQKPYETGGFTYADWGFLDESGAFAIPPQYDFAFSFSEGLACVEVNNLRGFIDRWGKLAIEPRFTMAFPFTEGLAAVSEDGEKFGYIDKTGSFVIPPTFDWAWPFSEGLAEVSGPYEEPASTFSLPADRPRIRHRAYGYIDRSGKKVIRCQFSQVEAFSEGLAVVSAGEGHSQRFGYIDRSGAWAIEPRFWFASSFRDGVAMTWRLPLWRRLFG